MEDEIKISPQIEESPRKEVEEELDALESSFLAMQSCRRRQRWVRNIGILAILVMILLFAKSLWDTAHKFSGEQFAQKLIAHSDIVTNNSGFVGIKDDVREVLIPAVKAEMLTAFKRNMPRFQAQGEVLLTELKKFAAEELKKEVIEGLTARLQATQKKISSQYSEADAQAITEAFAAINDKFVEELTAILELQLQGAIDSLGALDAQIQDFKNCDEYAEVAKLGGDEAQNLLLETMLELCIYELDPVKGAAPAEVATAKVEVK